MVSDDSDVDGDEDGDEEKPKTPGSQEDIEDGVSEKDQQDFKAAAKMVIPVVPKQETSMDRKEPVQKRNLKVRNKEGEVTESLVQMKLVEGKMKSAAFAICYPADYDDILSLILNRFTAVQIHSAVMHRFNLFNEIRLDMLKTEFSKRFFVGKSPMRNQIDDLAQEQKGKLMEWLREGLGKLPLKADGVDAMETLAAVFMRFYTEFLSALFSENLFVKDHQSPVNDSVQRFFYRLTNLLGRWVEGGVPRINAVVQLFFKSTSPALKLHPCFCLILEDWNFEGFFSRKNSFDELMVRQAA